MDLPDPGSPGDDPDSAVPGSGLPFARSGGNGHHESVTSGPGRGRQPARERPPGSSRSAAVLLEDVAAVDAGTPDSELLDRLEAALAQLPSAERAAVMTAYGYGEGSEAVGADLGPRRAGGRGAVPQRPAAAAGRAGRHAERTSGRRYPRLARTQSPQKHKGPGLMSGALCCRPARSPHGVRWLEATCLGPGAMDRIGKLLWCRAKATQS